jgi:hypothetical protein
MPKKPPRDNRRNRAARTVQSAAAVLQRLIPRRADAGFSSEKQPLEKALLRVPESLRPRVVSTVDKPEELVIFMESAVWAGRLKLALAADTGLTGGTRITVKVAPQGAVRR